MCEARISPRIEKEEEDDIDDEECMEKKREGSGIMQVMAAAKLIKTMKSLVANARIRREERIGWGLCGCSFGDEDESRGEERPFALALSSFFMLMTLIFYGAIKNFMLLSRDVKGIRCANCNLHPKVFYGITASAGFVSCILGIIITRYILKNRSMLFWSTRNGRKVVNSLGYEIAQLLITIVGIYSWVRTLEDLALIQVPGDPLNFLYVPFGKPNCTRRQPSLRHGAKNPLGINNKKMRYFYFFELFYFWAVALNALNLSFLRLVYDRTAYKPKLWFSLDILEAGALLSAIYPRIFDHWGFFGTAINGYSTYIFLGIFRFLRLIRFERICYCLFSYQGLQINVPFKKSSSSLLVDQSGHEKNQQAQFVLIDLNGVLIRYYLLLLKILTGFFTVAVIVCTLEYPCLPNATRRDHLKEAELCNPWFRRYDMCLYFLVVTMSTIGFGDMFPATRETRIFMILILLFVLMILPLLLAELAEYSDGDDCSDDDYVISSVAALWEELNFFNFELKRVTGIDSALISPSSHDLNTVESPLLLDTIAQQGENKEEPNPKKSKLIFQGARRNSAHIDDISLIVNDLERQIDQLQQNAAADRELVALLNQLTNIVVTKGLRLQGAPIAPTGYYNFPSSSSVPNLPHNVRRRRTTATTAAASYF